MEELEKQTLRDDISYARIDNLLVSHLAGSHAYGMNNEDSDVDVRGIFVAPVESICTPFYPIKEQCIPSMEDAKVYELANFLKLYTEGNPNILESLWVDEGDILSSTNEYWRVREYSEALLSKKVAFTFSGYAFSQLKRIKGHNKWINNPQPVEPPQHKDFLKLVHNFTEQKLLKVDMELLIRGHRVIHYGNDIFGITTEGSHPPVYTSSGEFNLKADQVEVDRSLTVMPKYLVKYNREEYKKAKEMHKNYWTWVKNRNPKRSATEAKFGYDTKHAAHLVRLLRMGEEILTGQGVIVKRPDAQELLDIRAGMWDYGDLVSWAEDKDKLIKGELYEKSSLPKKPQIATAAELLMEIQEEIWF